MRRRKQDEKVYPRLLPGVLFRVKRGRGQDMIEEILHNKIEKINEALAWIKDNRPDDYNQKFQQLV